MRLLWPWGLAALAAVALAAWWALRRPMRQVVLVSSLRLWTKALEALGPSAATRTRRVTASWALLLAGGVSAGLALSWPILYRQGPARQLGVAIYPAAELVGLPSDTLDQAVSALLARLDRRDRVRLVLPGALGGAGEFASPQEALRRLRQVRPLPVPAADLDLPEGDLEVQHLYRFAPATLALPDGPDVTTIALPAHPGDLTIEAFAIEEVPPASATGPSPAPGQAQVFLALRNHTAGPQKGQVLIRRGDQPALGLNYDAPPQGRAELVGQLPGGGDYYSAAIGESPGQFARAFLVRSAGSVRRLAMLGRDDPLVRRFLQVHPGVRLVGSSQQADAVVAVGAAPPAGVPALVIDPPAPPSPFQAAGTLSAIALRDADVLADHPLLGHVDLSGVSVRLAGAWRAGDLPAPQHRLVMMGANALLLAEDKPPRVYLAFDTATANTNFALTESFVIFMANAVKYVAAGGGTQVEYECLTPLAAGPRPDWSGLPAGLPSGPPAARPGPFPWPGVYRDSGGGLHAVSLTALESAEPGVDPQGKVASLLLPPPRPLSGGLELSAPLALLAVGLWLAGWAARLK